MFGGGKGVKISKGVKTDEFRLNNLNKLTNEQFPQHVAEKVAIPIVKLPTSLQFKSVWERD